MSNASRLTLLLALLAPGLASAQDAVAEAESETVAPQMVVERVSGRIPEEVSAFEETWARFQSRTKAYEAETREHLAAREAEERAELAEGYDQLIDTLEAMERDQRELTIERFEEFLRKYPNSPDASHVRFRLAELYFEKSKEEFFEKMAAFSEAEAAIDYESEDLEDQLALLGEPPMQDLSRNIALYERIVSDNLKLPKEERYEFLAGTFLMLGFSYYDPNSAQNDEAKAMEAYRGLIEHVPESEYVDRAHLFIGNHHFDYNEVDEAVSHYNEVLKKGPEGKFYGEALYQLAWSYYKLSYYDEALETFVKLLDFSEEQFNDTGRRSEFSPEAVRYMAISFADLADNETMEASVGTWHSGMTSPTAVARAYFQRVGNREYEWDIFVDLGEVLTQQARYDQAIEVYSALQEDPRWRLKPENPTFQWQVIKLHGSGTFADPIAQSRAQTLLTDRYNDRSEWWQANRSNAEALNKARGYIEQSLVNVGIEYREKAAETGRPEDWDQAITKFREYLEKFPIADDFYQVQFYLAFTLLEAQRYDEADTELEQLVKVGPVHPYLDMAIVQQFTARRQQVVNKYGAFDKLYDGAQIEKTYKTDFNREVTVYQISEDHQKFLTSIDRIIKHEFTEPEDDAISDMREYVEENEHAITYIAGQIYYLHNQYDKAREYLQQVIDKNRATKEANFAAKLLVDMANTEGNLALSRKLLSDFARNPPGVAEDIELDDAFFTNQLEGVAFKQCFALVGDELPDDQKDRAGAAECFLTFMTDFPESQYLSVALYNAANNYEIVGKAERANELFEQYVNDYPDDERSKGLYWRIASNYESTFDLDKAIRYYEGLVKNFPEFEDSPGALYNAAFLRIGLKDFEGAAKTFEKYVKDYSDLPDVEEMQYRAAEQYENADPEKGLRAYERYLKTYSGENADRTLEAAYKIAKYWQDKGNDRRYQKAMEDVLSLYEGLLEAGTKVGRNGTHYAAIAAFPAVQERFDAFTAFELTGNEAKDIPVLVQEKPEELAAFEEYGAGFITKFPDFEYVTASYYLIAEAYQWYANTGLAIQCPESMSMEECDIFYEILDTEVFPLFYNVQDKAIARYERIIEFGKEKRQYSDWIEKAQEALNKVDPRTFPAVKREIRGGTDSSVFPEIQPRTMDTPSEGEGEGN